MNVVVILKNNHQAYGPYPLELVAQLAQLDKNEVAWAIGEHGFCETDHITIVEAGL